MFRFGVFEKESRRSRVCTSAQRVTHKSGKSGKFTILEIWAAERVPRRLFIGCRNDHIMRQSGAPQPQQKKHTAGVTWTNSTHRAQNGKEGISDAFIKYSTGGGVQTLFGLLNGAHRPAYILSGNDGNGGQLSPFYKTAEGWILFDRGAGWWIANHKTGVLNLIREAEAFFYPRPNPFQLQAIICYANFDPLIAVLYLFKMLLYMIINNIVRYEATFYIYDSDLKDKWMDFYSNSGKTAVV
jgi:hypothetical protein